MWMCCKHKMLLEDLQKSKLCWKIIVEMNIYVNVLQTKKNVEVFIRRLEVFSQHFLIFFFNLIYVFGYQCCIVASPLSAFFPEIS